MQSGDAAARNTAGLAKVAGVAQPRGRLGGTTQMEPRSRLP